MTGPDIAAKSKNLKGRVKILWLLTQQRLNHLLLKFDNHFIRLIKRHACFTLLWLALCASKYLLLPGHFAFSPLVGCLDTALKGIRGASFDCNEHGFNFYGTA